MDKVYSLKILPSAKSDMANTLFYIKNVLKSSQSATNHRKMFSEAMNTIMKSPKSFQYDEFEPLYRRYIVGNYKVYYREFDDNGQVVIFRILYEGTDHTQKL